MKYKALIIEDEKAARERILSMKLWKGDVYTIAGYAANGKEGLKLYYKTKPDFIITDIEMPVMSGLDFMKELRKVNKSIPVIILSCYESFSYAQRAIQLGASDYLIKDFLEENVLRSTLSKVLGNFKRETLSKEVKLIVLDRLREIEIKEAQDFFAEETFFAFLCLHIDYFQKSKIETEAVIKMIREVLKEDNSGIIASPREGFVTILLGSGSIIFPSGIANRIIDFAAHKLSISITIAAGEIFKDIKELAREKVNTEKLLEYSVFLGRKRVILKENVSQISWLDPETVYDNLHTVKLSFIIDNRDQFFLGLKNLYTINTAGMIEYNYIGYINTYLISLLLGSIDEKHLRESEIFDYKLLEFSEIHTLETIADMYEWMKKRFNDYFTYIDSIKQIPSNIHVLGAIKLIKDEYANDLSLEKIATKLNIHRVYLSRIFKKETGKTCHEYIQQYRIKKAKEILLSTSHKIREVALLTGFGSYDQFAATFKKATGDTPGNFQKKLK